LVQVEEGLLKALLHDVFGILSNAGAAQRDGENPLLVTRHQDFERPRISVFGGSNHNRFIRF
jgi:hypothetical protein